MIAKPVGPPGRAGLAIVVVLFWLPMPAPTRAGEPPSEPVSGSRSEAVSEPVSEPVSEANGEPAPAQQGAPGGERAETLEGFSLAGLTVPHDRLQDAGVPVDGVPRVDDPRFADVESARRWVGPETPVIGVALEGEARAYPVHLMEHHMIVNDRVGDRALLVTYDPLTSSPRVYEAGRGEGARRFGFSGLLHSGGMALYELEERSLWSQFDGRRLTGSGPASLPAVEARQLPMAAWLERHPESVVLERPLLRTIDYRYSPYAAYWISERHPPVPHEDERFHPKEVLLGVVGERTQRAYLGSILTAAGGRIVDDFEGRKLRIAYDGDTATFDYQAPPGLLLRDAYWFAWKAFHPDTEVWNEIEAEDGP